jgi:hypothetical protein
VNTEGVVKAISSLRQDEQRSFLITVALNITVSVRLYHSESVTDVESFRYFLIFNEAMHTILGYLASTPMSGGDTEPPSRIVARLLEGELFSPISAHIRPAISSALRTIDIEPH